jgi:hypothetical protein
MPLEKTAIDATMQFYRAKKDSRTPKEFAIQTVPQTSERSQTSAIELMKSLHSKMSPPPETLSSPGVPKILLWVLLVSMINLYGLWKNLNGVIEKICIENFKVKENKEFK